MSTTNLNDGDFVQAAENVKRLAIHQPVCDELLQIILEHREKLEDDAEWLKTVAEYLESLKLWANLDEVEALMQCEAIPETLVLLQQRMSEFEVAIPEDYHKRARQSGKTSVHHSVLSVLRCSNGLERLECLPSTSLHKAMALLQSGLDHISPASDEYNEIRAALMHLQVVDSQATLEAPDLTAQILDISEEPFAKGGFSDVYTGEWLRQERVALKILRILGGSGATKRHKLFRREVKLWHGLRHPHLLQFWGLCNTTQGLAMVSPFMPNGNASAFLASNPDAGALELLVGAAYGLEYLHTRQPPITHGDLRGANILVSRTGQAQLSDFGLSKIMEAASTDTSVGMTTANAGATRWMAPELFHSDPVEYPPSCASPHPSTISLTGDDLLDHRESIEKPRMSEEKWQGVTPRSDVWAYGMTVYELMTGKVPYYRIKNSPTVMLTILRGDLPSKPKAADVRHDWQPQLLDLMHNCWVQRPGSRPTMTAISETMRSIRDASQARSPVPQSLLLAFDTPLPPLTPTLWSSENDKASSKQVLVESPSTETGHDVDYLVVDKHPEPTIELSLPIMRRKSTQRKSTTDSTLAKAEIADSVPELPAMRQNVPSTRADLARPRASSAPVSVPTELYLKEQVGSPKAASTTVFNSLNSSVVSLDSTLNATRGSRPMTPATPIPPEDPPSSPGSPVTRRKQRLSSLSFWKRNSTDKISAESTSSTEPSVDMKAVVPIVQALIEGEESMLRDTYDAVLSSRIRCAYPPLIAVEHVDRFLTSVLGSYIKLRKQRGQFLRGLKSAEKAITSDLASTVTSLVRQTTDCFHLVYPDYAKGIYQVEDIIAGEMEKNFPFRAWMQRSEDDMRLKRFLRKPLASIETTFVRLSQLIAFAKPNMSSMILLELKLREEELVGVLMKTRLSKWQGAMGRDEVLYSWRQLVVRTNSHAFLDETRQSVIFKFIETQMICLRTMKEFHSGVLWRIVQSPLLHLPGLGKIYGSMSVVIEHQYQLMLHLHAHQFENHPLLADVPQIVFQAITSWGDAYTTYSSQLCDALGELETHNADIFPLIHAIANPTIVDHGIASLLWAPVTHLRRLAKSLHQLLSVTSDDHVELKAIVEGISTITKLIEVCDNLSSSNGSSPEIRQLATQLQWQGTEDPLVRLDDPQRQLVHEGKLLLPNPGTDASSFTELFAIALDNCFILTSPQMRWGLSFLQVEEVIAMENLSILDLDESSSHHDLYLLPTPHGGEVIAAPLTLQFAGPSSLRTMTLLCFTTLEVLEWRRHLTAAKLSRESTAEGLPKMALVQHALVASTSFSPSCSAEFDLNGVGYCVVGGSRANGLWIRAGRGRELRQILSGVSIRYCEVIKSLQVLLVLVGKALVSYRLEDIAAFKVSSRQIETKGSVIFFRCRQHKERPILVVAVGQSHSASMVIRIFDTGVSGSETISRRSSFFGNKPSLSNTFKQVAEVSVAQILYDCTIFDDCIVLMGSDGFIRVDMERPDEHRQLVPRWLTSDLTVLPVFKGLASSQTYHRCKTSKPINIIRHNNVTLLVYADFGVFLKDGATVQGACIDWTSDRVLQACYLAPYVLLVSKTTIETRLIHNGQLVNRFDGEDLFITHGPDTKSEAVFTYFHLAAKEVAGDRQFDVDESDTFSVHQWSVQ